MKKLITIIAILFSAYTFAQDRSVKVEVLKIMDYTTTQRDALVVPPNETWHIHNVTTGKDEKNVGGAGWISDTGVTLDADDIDDSSTINKFTTASDISKLASIVVEKANAMPIGGATGTVLTKGSAADYNLQWQTMSSLIPTGINANKIATGIIDNTEFEYLNNLTGNIQTQFNGKQATLGAGSVTSTMLASAIPATKLADGSITNTELQYINSLTSNAQTQLDSKANESSVAHLAGTETFTGIKTFNAQTNFTTSLLMNQNVIGGNVPSPIGFAPTTSDWFSVPENTNSSFWMRGNYLNWKNPTQLDAGGRFTQSNTDIRTYTLPDKDGMVALMGDLSSSGTSKVAESALNGGEYYFTSTSLSETLTSALVKPASPNIKRKMWRTYMANDTITIPGNLPVGWSSVIEAGPLVDSLLIKPASGVDIYGQGNVFIQSGTGIDGLWLKKGRTVALVYKGANSVRAEGPWNVATLAPTNLYNTANAASPIAEANATTGFTGVGTTFSSVASPKTDGAYSIQGVTDTSTERWIYIARPSGVTAGKSYTIEIYIATNDVSPGSSLNISTSNQWSSASSVAIDLTDGNFKKYTITGTLSSIADANSGRLRIYIDNYFTAVTTWRIDNILWYEN